MQSDPFAANIPEGNQVESHQFYTARYMLFCAVPNDTRAGWLEGQLCRDGMRPGSARTVPAGLGTAFDIEAPRGRGSSMNFYILSILVFSLL